ncbi:MAG: hypothetical protein ACI8QF_000948 [Limisphaerales bacterium]|jgi:hypothetical protein
MMDKVCLNDVANRVATFRANRITHAELVEWAREALLASEYPPDESDLLMEILQDLSGSTPALVESALKNYGKVMQALGLEPLVDIDVSHN